MKTESSTRQVRSRSPMEDLPFIYDEAGRMEGFKNRIIYYETSRGCPFPAAIVFHQ